MVISHVVKGRTEDTPEEAVVSAIQRSLSKFKKGAQCVHIILAHLVPHNKKWKFIVSVVHEPDADDVPADPIIFAHLPEKYSHLYDDVLPHVDHLNLIEDESIWENIKLYLLDIYFYEAVHYQYFHKLFASDGGDRKGSRKNIESKPDVKDMMEEIQNTRQNFSQVHQCLMDSSFYEASDVEQARVIRERYLMWLKDRKNAISKRDSAPKSEMLLRELKKG